MSPLQLTTELAVLIAAVGTVAVSVTLPAFHDAGAVAASELTLVASDAYLICNRGTGMSATCFPVLGPSTEPDGAWHGRRINRLLTAG